MGLLHRAGRGDFAGPQRYVSGSGAAASGTFAVGVIALGPGGLRGRDSTALPDTAAIPTGYRNGGSWSLPRVGGELAATTTVAGSAAVSDTNLAGGLNAEASLSGEGSLSVALALIVQAVASLSGLGGLTADVLGKLEASASLAGSGSISGALAALAGAVCEIVGSGSATTTVRANGNISADLTPFTELSPQSLAASVWNSLVADFQAAGTMGLLLGEAGGGSSPSTIADAVWDEVASGHLAAGTFGAAVGTDLYTAKVLLVDDDAGAVDRYVVSWFRNGVVDVTGTDPKIQVVRVSDGADLVAETSMTEIGSTGRFRFDSSSRVVSGQTYLAIVSVTLDGSVRSWDQPVGRDG